LLSSRLLPALFHCPVRRIPVARFRELHLASTRSHPPRPCWIDFGSCTNFCAVSSVLGLVAAEALVTGAKYCAPTADVAAALLLIANVATAAAPATAAAFPALGPIGVLAASSARVFPAFSSTALPPTSATAGAAYSAVALTVCVVALPSAVAALRWVAVRVAKSASLGPGGLRLVLAPLRARSSAVSAFTVAWSPWAVRHLLSAASSWVRRALLAWASAELEPGRSSGACRLGGE
jgi:hypothetical protein